MEKALLMTMLMACHVGRPPPSSSVFSVGRVVGATAEASLEDGLEKGLSSALAQRGALGEGVPVDVSVLSFDRQVSGVGTSGDLVHTGTLTVEFYVRGPMPRRVVLASQRSWLVSAAVPIDAASERAAALAGLTGELSKDAAEWLLYAPEESP